MSALNRGDVDRQCDSARSDVGDHPALDRQGNEIEEELAQLFGRELRECRRYVPIQIADGLEHRLSRDCLVDGAAGRAEELQHREEHF